MGKVPLDPNCKMCGQEIAWKEDVKEQRYYPVNADGTPHTDTCPAVNKKAKKPKMQELGDFPSQEAPKQPAQAQGAITPAPVASKPLASTTQSKAFSATDLAEITTATGIPRGFIMMMGESGKERPFVLSEGLLYKAEKKGYRAIQIAVEEIKNDKGELLGYKATATLYPKLSKEDYAVLKNLPADPNIAQLVVKELTMPFIDFGSATTDNVKMKTMYPYLRELASTRARNRVLRLFTACGLTSVEELADVEIQEPD